MTATTRVDPLTHSTDSAGRPRLLFAASGTGGHLFPALAVAEALPEAAITWLGVPDRLETQLVPQTYPLYTVRLRGLSRPLGLSSLGVGIDLVRAVFQVRRLLQTQGIRGVFTTGGYIAAPAILAARSLGLPALIHDSNALPGKVTRWLGPWCSQVAVGFASAAGRLPCSRVTWTGTPVRPDFLDPPVLRALELPSEARMILVTGGSQGAVAVNRLVRQCVPQWTAAGLWVVHQTGDNDPEVGTVVAPQYLEQPFFGEMAALMARADVVIGRAGAGTLTELAVLGKPAVLIPYPAAADDHQTVNAQAFVDAGAALMLPQAGLTALALQQTVLDLIQRPAELTHMAAQAQTLAVRDSHLQLAQLCRTHLLGRP